MPNIFLTQPDRLSVDTSVETHRRLDDGRPAIVAAANPMRPAGGGQPTDYGVVLAGRNRIPIEQIIKSNGQTWLVPASGEFADGDPIRIEVDAPRRLQLSQSHSLTHLAMAAIRGIVPGYESKGADIGDDGVGIQLRFRSKAPVSAAMLRAIDLQMRDWIARGLPITATRARSIPDAAVIYPMWRVDPDLELNGRVRVIVIRNVDANPCSGTHVNSTGEIGSFAILGHERGNSGNNIIHLAKS